jgi:hypothetical protein
MKVTKRVTTVIAPKWDALLYITLIAFRYTLHLEL